MPATLITGTTSELARPYCASPDVPSGARKSLMLHLLGEQNKR